MLGMLPRHAHGVAAVAAEFEIITGDGSVGIAEPCDTRKELFALPVGEEEVLTPNPPSAPMLQGGGDARKHVPRLVQLSVSGRVVVRCPSEGAARPAVGNKLVQ